MTDPVLQVEGLLVRYGLGPAATVAVAGVDLEIAAGEVLGLVGESGSGKSTVARAVMGLLPVAAGTVRIAGRQVAGRDRRARRERALDAQLIFQDPYSSLDPRMTVRQIIGESLDLRSDLSPAQAGAEIVRLLELVNLEPSYAERLPRQMSGGQRQRVAIARALAVRPQLLIADEITSALDVSVQATILNLLRQIRRAEGLSMLFISHNLATVRFLSDRIAVMRNGQIVETGPIDDVIAAPAAEYTSSLLAAVPELRLTGPQAHRSTIEGK